MGSNLLQSSIMACALVVAGPETASAQQTCDPEYPIPIPIGCSSNPLIGPDKFVGCDQLKVDIVAKSFLAHQCPSCTGLSCYDCWHEGMKNAINKWNHAHNVLFGWHKFVEVGGRPYNVQYRMRDDEDFRNALDDHNFHPDPSNIAFFVKKMIDSTCCNESSEVVTVVKLYFQAFDTTPGRRWSDSVPNECPEVVQSVGGIPIIMHSVKRFAAHELGHALGLEHANIPDSIMEFDACGDGPLAADGYALACIYWPIYECCSPQ